MKKVDFRLLVLALSASFLLLTYILFDRSSSNVKEEPPGCVDLNEEVIGDLSRELLICYSKLDKVGQYYDACVAVWEDCKNLKE